jgi:uncharacterized protein (DUF1015 family)
MAEVKPFKGLLYNPDLVGDVSSVMAPPYDVISPEMRENLYGKSEFNIVKLILGKEFPEDNEKDNKYSRSKRLMDDWIEKKALSTDSEDALYVYLQEYKVRGVALRRIGFLALMKVEGDDVVLPHEHTLSRPKEDRMKLIKSVESNLSPIFGLYAGDGGYVSGILRTSVANMVPVFDLELDGERHALWRLTDSGQISGIVEAMEGRKVFIADGHHRYAVAKAYRDECREKEGYDGRADHVLMYLTDMSDPDNLTVLATHRVIKRADGIEREDFLSLLGEYFNLTRLHSLDEVINQMDARREKSYVYGLYDGSGFTLLEPMEESALRELIKDKPESWKDLDVSVLHSSVFDKILGIKAEEGDVVYVKDPEDAENIVKSGEGKAAFFLNPTKIGQLKAVAEDGEMMPQKSTYFYPKLLTGLVINRFEDQKEKVR